MPGVLALFVLPLIMQDILDISGKSVGEYFAFFLLGYFLLSQDRVLEQIDRALIGLIIVFAAGYVVSFAFGMEIYAGIPLLGDVISEIYAWVGILALLSIARRYWNVQNKFTAYMAKSSFGVLPVSPELDHRCRVFSCYSFTQTPALQIPLILLLSVPLTFFNIRAVAGASA